MFFLRWAFKNIQRNKWRSVSLIALLMLTSMIFFLSIAFIRGSRIQMNSSLRLFNGDVLVKARDDSKNLNPCIEEVRKNDSGQSIEAIIEECTLDCDIITNVSCDHASIVGVSESFFQMEHSLIEWHQEYHALRHHEAFVEEGYAKTAGLKINDYFTASYRTENGAINTGTYTLANIFTGNKYENAKKIYIPLINAQTLSLKHNYINGAKIFVRDENGLRFLQGLLHTYQDDMYVWTKQTANERHIFYRIFNFASLFATILLSIVIAVLLMVVYFAIQTAFYLIFNERKNEISVLSTYGMNYQQLFKLVSEESLMIMLTGILFGYLLSLMFSFLIGGINVANVSGDIVAVVGGTYLKFDFDCLTGISISVFITSIGLISTYSSLMKYLRNEVIEMQKGI